MDVLDLFALRASYNAQNIMLCFNGPFSRSLIEELGAALRNYLQRQETNPSSAMDVFAVYIEMAQNIRHYSNTRHYDERDAAATVVIAREESGRHMVSAGNVVEAADGARLLARIQQLAAMDKPALKAAYKEVLRLPRAEGQTSGAGLGLIDMARKSTAPMVASLREMDSGRAFFSLSVTI